MVDSRCMELSYASWMRRLMQAYTHLSEASSLWERCMGQAALCSEHPEDCRLKAYEAMNAVQEDEDNDFISRDEVISAMNRLEASIHEMLERIRESGTACSGQ